MITYLQLGTLREEPGILVLICICMIQISMIIIHSHIDHRWKVSHALQIHKLQMDSAKLSYNIDNVLGSTATNINHVGQAQGCLVYLASAFVVFYSPILDQQVAYLRHSSSFVSAIAVSSDEKLIAIADRSKPVSISIYAIDNLEKLRGNQVKPIYVLRGHKHNIDLLVFSPNAKYLLSISNHDGSMFLWEKGECVTKNRVSKTIAKAVFDNNGDLVTVGRGYLKIWKFNDGEVLRKKQDDCWIMQGKVLTFGKVFSSKDFIEIAFYHCQGNNQKDKIVLLSSDGIICIMSSSYQKAEKWIDLVMPRALGLKIVKSLAICGGDNSLIKSIDLQTLTLSHKFPKPPPNNKENLNEQEELEYGEEEEFPPCTGILQVSDFIVTLYANRTVFIWQLNQQPTAVRSIISHRGIIHSLSLLHEIKGDISFFGSSSEDGTIRLWHFYKKEFSGEQKSIDIAGTIGLKRNVYCRNLTRIIYSHSESPIIRMRLFQKNTLACISSQEFLLYSLENFQLLLLHTFDQQQNKHPSRFLTFQTHEDLVYIGDEAGKLKVYRPQGEILVKLREFQLEMPIQTLQIFSKRLLMCGKGRLKCITLEGETLLNQYNVQCGVGFNNNLIYCQKKSAVIYNLTRNRKTGSVTLSHQLDEHQSIKVARSNSWLIVLLTNKNKIIITNFSSVVLYSEDLSECITDYTVSQGGEIILSTESGTILIRRQENNRYVRIDEKVKRWFEMNDMSWMDGSVWASSKNKSHSNSNPNQILSLQGVENMNSIRLGDDSVYKSVGIQPKIVSDLVLSYKNQENKRSIFNPSSICAQANKIYNNVNELIKNRGAINSPTSIAAEKSKSVKRRIFKEKDMEMSEKSEYVPTFSNNLVESVMRENPPSQLSKNQKEVVSTEDNDVIKSKVESSINFGFVEFQEESRGHTPSEQFNYTKTRTQSPNNEFLTSVDVLLQNQDKLANNKEYVHTMLLDHYQQYQKLYSVLNIEFGKKREEEWKKQTREKFQKISAGFLDELEK